MKRNKSVGGGYVVNGRQLTFSERVARDFKRNWMLYLMLLPIIVYYLIFKFGPMFGLTIAFMDYKPAKGFFNSNWVGLKHFKNFFGNYYFGRLLRNTIRISFFSLLTFPVPIILALLLNELKSKRFSKWAQTITYIPPVSYTHLDVYKRQSEDPIGGWISYGYAWRKPIPQDVYKRQGGR